jgi:predicted GH43/DUF377 family glycosyl hydrolase
MISFKRSNANPLIKPNPDNDWESMATFNGCVVRFMDTYHMVYRAQGKKAMHEGVEMNLSTIGYAKSHDGVHFTDRRQLLKPEFEWEKFGCEDPRITYFEGKYYIFYTALSTYPFTPAGIKCAVAITEDFKSFQKHLVTPFNAKAMALFPERINGKLTVVLTAHTDMPPARICYAQMDTPDELWSVSFWDNWYRTFENYAIPLQRSPIDHIEVGAPPIKTPDGWLFFYSYIQNYAMSGTVFGIEVALLHHDNPQGIESVIPSPLLMPEAEYELKGVVPNITFPSGAVKTDNTISLYYGAADTYCALALCELDDLLDELKLERTNIPQILKRVIKMDRFENNPIISPIKEHSWESKFTYNPGAIYLDGKVHILYRAQGDDDTSVLGYASAKDGMHIDERLAEPVYVPRIPEEQKKRPGFSGCEDPRLVELGGRVYMTYTAYDAVNPTRIALTSISVDDFIHKQWNWDMPKIISTPAIDDKNSCLLPEKIDGKYIFFHRISPCIWIDAVDDLSFPNKPWLHGRIMMRPRHDRWDSEKVGIAGPPLKTEKGWLLIYHALSRWDKQYRLGAMLLDLQHPEYIISRLDHPILEPELWYDHEGLRPGTVFGCGTVLLDGNILVYYGGADSLVAGAYIKFQTLLDALTP